MNRSRTSSDEARPGSADPGRVIVLSGPSGVGKTTVAGRLLEDPRLERVVTATTRAPRPGEQDHRDYTFLTREQFAALRRRGQLLEWAEVYGSCYGTPRAHVDRILAAGRIALLVIDIQGAETLRDAGLRAVFIFLLPPAGAVLEERLARRATEEPTGVARRLAVAREEIARADWFEHRIRNDDLDRCVADVRRAAGLD